MTLQIDITDPCVQRAIKDLEDADFLPTLAKAHILLVASGSKPAMHTDLIIDFTAKRAEPYQVDDSDINRFTTIITNLGLKYRLEAVEFTSSLHKVRTILHMVFIAKNADTIDQLLHARAEGDERREGILLGYPESSVVAFVNDDMIAIDDVPEFTKLVTGDDMKFLSHRLSKDNWEYEIRYLPVHSRIVKQISPRIYNQCLLI